MEGGWRELQLYIWMSVFSNNIPQYTDHGPLGTVLSPSNIILYVYHRQVWHSSGPGSGGTQQLIVYVMVCQSPRNYIQRWYFKRLRTQFPFIFPRLKFVYLLGWCVVPGVGICGHSPDPGEPAHCGSCVGHNIS